MKENHYFAFVNCTIFDGRVNSEIIPDGVILIHLKKEGNKKFGYIEKVGKKSEIEISEKYKIIDLKDKFVIPGLINAHAHLTGDGKPRKITTKSEKEIKRLLWIARRWIGKKLIKMMMKRNLKNALNSGVTAIRALGDPYYYDLEIRDEIEKGKFLGPRLLVAGKALCITGGHGWYMAHVVDSPWEARKAVRENVRKGVDVIKLISTGGVMDSKRLGEAGRPQMTIEEISAACDEAHRAGLLVAAHAESILGVKEALLGGVDTIEHGADLDEECIKLFKENPKTLRGYASLIPTLSAPINISEWSTKELEMSEIQLQNTLLIKDGIINGFKKAVKNNISIGVGTDATVTFVTHYDFWRELVFMAQYGNLEPKQVIHLATLGNARILGIDNITGSIEPSKSADFVVLNGNVLEDLNYLEKPYMIVIRGRIINRPKIRKIKKIEKLKRKKENMKKN
ncbi:MAG: amidohydrolase family protein, partial [Candidatus Helarchaeota archaeon]